MNKLLWFVCPSLFFIPPIFPLHIKEANKDGILNVYFVKIGWFWTSVICALCVLRYSNLVNHWKRYVLLTIWWIVFTQEMFGFTPIMDLVFLKSGGMCSFNIFDDNGIESQLNINFHDNEFRRFRGLQRMSKWLKVVNGSTELKNAVQSFITREKTPTYSEALTEELIDLSKKVRSSSACAHAGGHWVGGHDPSGHIFLITLMLMFMIGEFSQYQDRATKHLKKTTKRFFKRTSHHLIELLDNGAVKNIWLDDPTNTSWLIKVFVQPPLKCYRSLSAICYLIVYFVIWENPIILLFIFTILWSFSFVVTILLFHTFWEKLSGFIAAYLVSLIICQVF